MDEVDIAQRSSDVILSATIEAARRCGRGSGRKTCLECGEVIPNARRKAMPGCELCVDCQREFEKA